MYKCIKAVTFDLWDTVFVDDSDEPKRKDQGLLPKSLERRRLFKQFLDEQLSVSEERLLAAYDTVDAAFRQVWYGHNRTWTVPERLNVLLKGLGRDLPRAELAELVRLHEEMELAVRPDLAPGILEAIQGLQEHYRLGVISDTIFSPGRVLRKLLEDHGLFHSFSSFVFSDELGCSKPDSRMFSRAARELGVAESELLHVGDREAKDVAGPHLVGAKAILSTVVKDRGREQTEAEAVCSDYKDLMMIVDRMND